MKLNLFLNFKFSADADAWLWLSSSFLVEILKLGLVKYSGDADVWLRFLVDA